MVQSIQNTQHYTNSEEETNVKLIYDYTESLHKSTSDNLDVLNTRFGVAIAYGGVLLRFAMDLSGQSITVRIPEWGLNLECPMCLWLKLGVLILATASICASVLGLFSKSSGKLVHPKRLMQNWYRKSEERCRCHIINTWIESIDQLRKSRKNKANKLNCAIGLLVASTIVFAVDIGIESLFGST
jgi:hypothetical protein